MATYTPNLNLEKFGENEFYTVTKFNANADKIDTAVGENAAGLAGLAAYSKYWWTRAAISYIAANSDTSLYKQIAQTSTTGETFTVQYSASVNITNGIIALASPLTVTASYSTYSTLSCLSGNYFQSLVDNEIYYASGTTPSRSSANSKYTCSISAIKPTATRLVGTAQYICSENRNAYPDSGDQGGYEYRYLGKPGDAAVRSATIETGYYIGTGTYGADSPNSLTFGFVPKVVFIAAAIGPTLDVCTIIWGCEQTQSNSANSSNAYRIAMSYDGNMLSWHSATGGANESAGDQLNTSGQMYRYVAVG